MNADDFRAASEAAENWIYNFGLICAIGAKKPEERGLFNLKATLTTFREDYQKHAEALNSSMQLLTAESDGPIELYSNVYSSVHEAAADLVGRLLADSLSLIEKGVLDDEQMREQWTRLHELWHEGDANRLAERLRRERAKLLHQQPEDEFLPAETPSECAKRLQKSLDTLKRYIKTGKLRCKKVTARSWRLHREDLRTLGGKID